MMSMEEVKARLRRWARAVVGGRVAPHLGLPGHCTYLEFAIKASGRPPTDIGEAEWQTDRLVRKLGEHDGFLRMIVEAYYLDEGLQDANVSKAGFSRMTYFRRLDEAHEMLMRFYVTEK
jgi:hypothetical protein